MHKHVVHLTCAGQTIYFGDHTLISTGIRAMLNGDRKALLRSEADKLWPIVAKIDRLTKLNKLRHESPQSRLAPRSDVTSDLASALSSISTERQRQESPIQCYRLRQLYPRRLPPLSRQSPALRQP